MMCTWNMWRNSCTNFLLICIYLINAFFPFNCLRDRNSFLYWQNEKLKIRSVLGSFLVENAKTSSVGMAHIFNVNTRKNFSFVDVGMGKIGHFFQISSFYALNITIIFNIYVTRYYIADGAYRIYRLHAQQ